MVFPVTNLSLNKPWVPSGGLRQSRDHCNEPLRPPLPRSPQVGEEEGERAPQTHLSPLGEAEEAVLGCLLLKQDRKRITEREFTDGVFVATFMNFMKSGGVKAVVDVQ